MAAAGCAWGRPENGKGDRRIPSFLMDNGIRRLISPPGKTVGKYVEPGHVVVDLGSGPGFYSLPMAEKVGRSGRVYAVDFDSKSIEKLKAKSKGRGLDGTVEAHACSAAQVDFIPDASVDFVLANGLLCCMVDHRGALDQVKRILKPTGKAYFRVSRTLRKSDPRSVTKEEWRRALEGFTVLERGENLGGRWALVSVRK